MVKARDWNASDNIFYKQGVMHKKFVPEVTTVNNKFCVHMLAQ